MATIFQTTFSNEFSWMKMYKFRSRFHWSLFRRIQLTLFQHWFRQWLGAVQATSHHLNQWWLAYRRIYASLGLNELRGYRLFKKRHAMEPSLYLVKESKYRITLTRPLASSHRLEIERGRYSRPKTHITERLGPCDNIVEEGHTFLLNCKIYDQDRFIMFSKLSTTYKTLVE